MYVLACMCVANAVAPGIHYNFQSYRAADDHLYVHFFTAVIVAAMCVYKAYYSSILLYTLYSTALGARGKRGMVLFASRRPEPFNRPYTYVVCPQKPPKILSKHWLYCMWLYIYLFNYQLMQWIQYGLLSKLITPIRWRAKSNFTI